MVAKRWLSVCAVCVACGGADDGHPLHGAAPFGPETVNEDAPYRAAIEAMGAEGVTTVTVSLYDGQDYAAAALELKAGDVLVARSGANEVTLAHAENTGEGSPYVGILPGDAAGTHIAISLESERLGDAQAEVVLPDHFTLTAPRSSNTLSLDEPIEFTWKDGKAADTAQMLYELSCAEGFGSGYATHGEDRSRDTLEVVADDLTGPCDVTLGLKRQNFGTLSGAWGGIAIGAQLESVSFASVPTE
jgi:hypothetical protein